ncbi:MAG: thiosulfate oxidation carrier protein SoxY [Gammaproteobacteria bacterium]|jgi:sulfur-oxidizing protein SoxY|nr:thiosulfate oxidation carrier protein SoxY [Gammaproteobacteria bacterium]MBT4494917.1 thiosulfate oxidation carrier protein SoxY [Gammaproteobacteria bacterium]MBT7369997.1 thiosulfate oxidation carrier protein SoxY [Gammaproteobacteria bacterium]
MKTLQRRRVLQALLTVSAVMALPIRALARATDAFSSKSVDNALTNLLGGLAIEESEQIKFKIPDIAENGAVVPVRISTTLEDVDRIYLLIDKNPTPLSAVFEIGPRIMPDVSTRVKIGKSSVARVIVRAGGKAYMTSKEVKVTIGGCGG